MASIASASDVMQRCGQIFRVYDGGQASLASCVIGNCGDSRFEPLQLDVIGRVMLSLSDVDDSSGVCPIIVASN